MSKIDLIILGVIVIFVFIGYMRGLIGSLLSLLQYIIVIVLSIRFAPFIAGILINTFKLDIMLLDWIHNYPSAISNAVSLMSSEVLQSIVGRIINLLSVVILFIVLKLLFGIIVSLLNKIAKLPILNEVNKLGGILIGAAEGVLFVYLGMIVINWLPISALNPVRELLPASFIGAAINSCVPAAASDIIDMVKVITT